MWICLQCRDYPGIKIALGRKELTRLKQSTLISLFREAHPLLKIPESSFTYQDQKSLVTYINGSTIQLIDLARQPSDPDFDSFGSLLFTHVVIEEAGEITLKAKNAISSRTNRWLNDKYKITGKTLLTGNPSQNFTRDEYYEPYKALGGGVSQLWPYGSVYVGGDKQTAYRAFIRALPTDNPFISLNYLEHLKTMPMQERKRLYEGDWDYSDDDNMLFKDLLLDRSLIGEVDGDISAVGVDVADVGKDKTVVSIMRGNILVEQIEMNIDTTGEKAVSEQTALELIKICQMRGLDSKKANLIGVDTIGIGVGLRDFMRSKGWYISSYIAGNRPSVTGYNNLRSQTYWDLAQDLDKGNTRIYSQLQSLKDSDSRAGLRRQLKAHEYISEAKVIKIMPKNKVKELLGRSPDNADSFVIANWIKNGGMTDDKQNINRIYL